MKQTFDFINRFRSIYADKWTFADAVKSGIFEFCAVTKSGKTIPSYGSPSFDCSKLVNAEPLKPIKVIRHKKDSTSITVQYEKIGFVRFWYKSML